MITLRTLATLALALVLASASYAEDSKVKQDAKEAGKAVGTAAHDVGHGVKKVAKDVGKAVSTAAREAGHAARDGAKEFNKAVKGESSAKKSEKK